jgi:hypothetical protein
LSFSVHNIDVEKLASSPESDEIVRLMVAMNDIDQLPLLGRLLDKEKLVYPELWKYHDGITGSLIRQRSARTTEALDCLTRRLIRDHAATEFPIIHSIIEADEALRNWKTELRELLDEETKEKTEDPQSQPTGDQPTEKLHEKFERHRQIRHRLVDHYDHKKKYEIIPEGLKLFVQQGKRGEDGLLRGWLVYGNTESNKHIRRFLLADEVLNTIHREPILQIPHDEDGYKDSEKLIDARDFTLEFMRLFQKFSGRLIDLYLKKHDLWIQNVNPSDLLAPRSEPTMLPETISQLDVHSFAEVTQYLGSTSKLVDDVSALYELLMKLVVNAPKFAEFFDINQRTAFFHCLQSLRYTLIMSVTTLFRGHVTDSTNYSRRAIEICAFLVEICSDTESAKRWIEMGKSGNARDKYKSRFQAHQVVKKHKDILSEEVDKLYDNFCLFVHPSYFSMHFQISTTGKLEHQFHYFKHESEDQRVNLITQYFILLNAHVCLVKAFARFIDKKDIGFDDKVWQERKTQCIEKVEQEKTAWKPVLDAFMEKMRKSAAQVKIEKQNT